MKIWMLQWFCSDIAGYEFEGLFHTLDGIYDYLAETYPEDEFHVMDDSGDDIDIWNSRQQARFQSEMFRNRLDQADFNARRIEVK